MWRLWDCTFTHKVVFALFDIDARPEGTGKKIQGVELEHTTQQNRQIY